MKKGVTIKDIARKLNMSISTVSKALNNHPSISSLTKERVQKLADEWGYIPNETARHFKQSKSFTIAVIMPDLLDQFYVLAVNGVEEISNKRDYNVIVFQTHEDHEKETNILENIMRNRVDGVIIAISKNTRNIEKFRRLIRIGVPVVFFSRSFAEEEFDFISTDNEGGAQKAVEFLIGRGHQRIAHLMGPSFLRTTHQRLQGYENALLGAKIQYDPQLVLEIDFTRDKTFEAVEKLRQLKDPPTAFFTFKNYVSLDVLEYFKSRQPNLLNTIDVAGFGNLPLIKYLDHKPVASVDENSYMMGKEAAQLIFEKIDAHNSNEQLAPRFIKVPATIVEN